jgi:hypothetical protein
MRSRHWFFIVSMGLFVSGIGFVIAAERSARATVPEAAPAAALVPAVATVKQVMNGIVQPGASAVWDSVSTIVSENGVEEKRPRTTDEWAQVSTSAAMVIESANLLMDPGRAIDTGEWAAMARAMAASAGKALEFANAQNVDGILQVGDELNRTCDNCHERYSRN